MSWLAENWVNVLACVGAFDGFLFLFAKLTPWKWDDNAYQLLHKFFLLFLPKKQ